MASGHTRPTTSQGPSKREGVSGAGGAAVLGRRHPRARHTRDAPPSLRPVHPEPDPPGWGRTPRAHGARAARDRHDAECEKGPQSGRPTPNLLPREETKMLESWQIATLKRGKCERGDLNPHGCLAHRILNPARLPVPPLSRAAAHSGKPLSAQAFRPGGLPSCPVVP